MNKKNDSNVDELLRGFKRSSDLTELSSEEVAGIDQSDSMPVGAQLIERDDGSQVMRVRKRKRRTKQPKKEEALKVKKRKVLIVFSAVVSLFVLAITLAVLLAYRNSSKFNEKVTESIAATSGAEVELGTLSVTPQKVSVQNLDLSWEDSFLETLELRKIVVKTHPVGFFGGTWRIEECGAERAVLKIREGGEPDYGGDTPLKYSGDLFDVVSLDCQFGDSGGFMKDTSVRLRTGNGVSVDFEGGILQFGPWKGLNVGSGYLSKLNEGLDLNLRFQSAEDYNEWLEVGGKLSNDYEVKNDLELTADMYPIENLLGDHLGKFIHGPFRTNSGRVEFVPGNLNLLKLEVPIDGQGIRVDHFPFLIELGAILEDTDILNYEFIDEARASFHYSSSEIELREITFSTHNEFLMKGFVKVSAEGVLSGEFKFGVGEDKEGYFDKKGYLGITRNGGDGYLWMTVKLSGTLKAPKDDFSAQLAGAQKASIQNNVAPSFRGKTLPSREQQLEDAFDSLLGN